MELEKKIISITDDQDKFIEESKGDPYYNIKN